jgi:hypothetical protein
MAELLSFSVRVLRPSRLDSHFPPPPSPPPPQRPIRTSHTTTVCARYAAVSVVRVCAAFLYDPHIRVALDVAGCIAR